MVKLRGHHLLCILCYGGAGYTPEFVANMSSLIERINNGESIEIVSGIDDICAALRHGSVTTCEHARVCRLKRVGRRDRLALNAVARALRLSRLEAGDALHYGKSEVRQLRLLFSHKAIRAACVRCPWYARCSKRADSHFSGSRLLPTRD